MRVLYFSLRECWPTDTGARLRDFHLAKGLARNSDLHYLGLIPAKENLSGPPPDDSLFRSYTIAAKPPANSLLSLLRGLIGPQPLVVLNNFSAHISRTLRSILGTHGPFDTVQIEGVHLAPYCRLIRELSPQSAIVADWHNIESEIMHRFAANTSNIAKKLYAHRTARLIERSESYLLREATVNCVTSEREKRILSPIASPGTALEVIPNGVDCSWFASCPGPDRECQDLLYVGSMDYHANIDAVLYFCREIWPFIRQRHPQSRFLIVGRRPDLAVQALAGIPGVVITGTVEDVRPYYAKAAILVVPLRVGGGTRLKILEAMAAGVPVISSPLGAEGIEAERGLHWVEATSMESWVSAVGSLLGNLNQRQSMANSARRLVKSRYDWEAISSRLVAIHQRVSRSG